VEGSRKRKGTTGPKFLGGERKEEAGTREGEKEGEKGQRRRQIYNIYSQA
jgi:hypothetical protein